MDSTIEVESAGALDLASGSRSYRLREMYWSATHETALVEKRIAGSCEDTLLGHAMDFAALLEASDPFIQSDELIVGSCLAAPQDGNQLDFGFYDPHFPPGHRNILRMGLAGMRDNARGKLELETDPDKQVFLEAVAIAYDGACSYVQKYALCATEMALLEIDPYRRDELERIATVCDDLAVAPPASFHAALQLVQFTRIFGGNGCIGRFDQWMVPFYERDISDGFLTREEAQELLECFFIKLNEFPIAYIVEFPTKYRVWPRTADNALFRNDNMRNIMLAGQTPSGTDACNELTVMCLKAAARLMLPEPKLNVRFFGGSPRSLLRLCCRVLAKGLNVLAIFNDDVAIPALTRLGIPIEDARDYCNDGCSELIIDGRSFSRFQIHDSLSALNGTVQRAETHAYPTFHDVIEDLKSRVLSFVPDGAWDDSAITFPYFAASIDDCLRAASPTGARYRIWGSILAEVGNTADGLAAIKKFIYDDGVLTWHDLVSAIKANYEGYERLRQMLRNRAPKYGNDIDMVDEIAKEVTEYFCDSVHERAHNQVGYSSKHAAGLMLFYVQLQNELPASPDGRRQGEPVASSLSPSLGMDRNGPTAVLRSASKIDLTRASFGSVLDIALHSSVAHDEERFDKLVSLIDCFLKLPSTSTLQVNLIDKDTLLKARENPNAPQYRTLIVRVWGFSAVFVELSPALQEHVLTRTEHKLGPY